MKHAVFLFCLMYFSFSALSQELRIQGHLIDEEKNDLVAATVRCYVDDTLFVKGVVANSKGEFELKLPSTEKKYKLLFNYLGYQETSFVLHPTKETLIRLGEIILDKKAVQMQEVTVLAQNRVQTEDKMMIYPTREQLRYAYDGYSALDALQIPGLFAGKGAVNYRNGGVLLCINGREATQEEVLNLYAKDIKRVDFYSQGRPDYPGADAVIDYVLKERDYVGTVAVNGGHELNKPEGFGRGTAQYFEGKSEWAISVSDAYTHFTGHDKGYTETTYSFPDETIIRRDDKLPSLKANNRLKAYLNYIYRDKKQTFYTSLRMNRTTSDAEVWNRQQYSNTSTTLIKQENKNSSNLNPALQLQYNRTLPKRQRLRAELYGSYGNNNYDRWYEQRADDLVASSYANATDEDSWYGKMKLNYTKTFKNKSSFNLELNQDFTHTYNLNTKEGVESENRLSKSNTRLFLVYNYRIQKKLNLQVRLAEHLSYIETKGSHVFNSFFVPSLKLSYLSKGHSLQLTGSIKSIESNISNRTAYEYKRNEYELFVGNPNLKDYWEYSVSLSYDWTINPRFTFYSLTNLYGSNRQVYGVTAYDDSRKMFVYRNLNGGSGLSRHHELGSQYAIIPKKMYVRTTLIADCHDVRLWDKISFKHLFGGVYVTYMHKGWRIGTGCLLPTKNLQPTSGYIIKSPSSLSLDVSYHINNLHISLGGSTPYKATTKTKLEQGGFMVRGESRIPRVSDHRISLSASYRFTFGKKKHKFDNTVIQDTNQSTISTE